MPEPAVLGVDLKHTAYLLAGFYLVHCCASGVVCVVEHDLLRHMVAPQRSVNPWARELRGFAVCGAETKKPPEGGVGLALHGLSRIGGSYTTNELRGEMKHSTDELILASHLRSIAIDIRESEAIKHAALNHNGALTGRAEYKKSHPLPEFYEAALVELQGIADTYLRR